MKHYNQPRLVKHNGYRHTASSTPVTSSVSQVNAAARSVQSQLDQINKRIDEMTVLPFRQAGGGLQDIGQTSSATLRVCFRCKEEKHIKTKCNWDGQGEPSPDTKCKLCFRMGHGAPRCKKLAGA